MQKHFYLLPKPLALPWYICRAASTVCLGAPFDATIIMLQLLFLSLPLVPSLKIYFTFSSLAYLSFCPLCVIKYDSNKYVCAWTKRVCVCLCAFFCFSHRVYLCIIFERLCWVLSAMHMWKLLYFVSVCEFFFYSVLLILFALSFSSLSLSLSLILFDIPHLCGEKCVFSLKVSSHKSKCKNIFVENYASYYTSVFVNGFQWLLF